MFVCEPPPPASLTVTLVATETDRSTDDVILFDGSEVLVALPEVFDAGETTPA